MLRVAERQVCLMSETQEKTSKTYDPFETFRAMRDAYLDAMAKVMVGAVNTEAYAQATGNMLESYLTAVAPFREALDKSMLQMLQQLELPSRQEVAALAERFTNVEMRLDDMDAKLDAIQKRMGEDGSGSRTTQEEAADPTRPAAAIQAGSVRAAANRPAARRPFVRRRVTSTKR
jgi:polyhydroxyalkanoate synthesis regulator phasin